MAELSNLFKLDLIDLQLRVESLLIDQWMT